MYWHYNSFFGSQPWLRSTPLLPGGEYLPLRLASMTVRVAPGGGENEFKHE